MLLRLEEKLNDYFDRILLKLHPAGYFDKKRLIKEIGGALPEKFEFVQGRLEDYLSHVCVGICGSTGTAVEMALQAVPVIVIGASQTLTLNYLSCTPEPNLWRLCFTTSEVLTALRDFREMKVNREMMLKEKALQLRKLYFASDQEKCWENFLFNKNSTSRQHEKCYFRNVQ